MSFGPPAIRVEGVKKSFALPGRREGSVPRPRSKSRRGGRLEVLSGISFEVAHGEYFGVVGKNGSGKSTLLKVVAGIYSPDAGAVSTDGRVGPALDLGVGFSPELTTRQNAIINGVILGLGRKTARRRVDSILSFAELHDFSGVQLKNLSTGMRARLAFATMLQTDPDILLVDEALAVGDQEFQERCTEAMDRMRRQGRTIVLVTHAMQTIERLCDRALVLDAGQIAHIGQPQDVATRYAELNFPTNPAEASDSKSVRSIQNASVCLEGSSASSVAAGEPLALLASFTTRSAHGELLVRVEVKSGRGIRVCLSSDLPLVGPASHLNKGVSCIARIVMANQLVPGNYAAIVLFLRKNSAGQVVRASEPASAPFRVEGDSSRARGMVTLDVNPTWARVADRPPDSGL